MKINRITAKNIKDAMRVVKEKYPNDAVILSNKAIKDGVELLVTDVESAPVENKDEKIKNIDNPKVCSIDTESSIVSEVKVLSNKLNNISSLLKHQMSHLVKQNLELSEPLVASAMEKLLAMGIEADIAAELLKDFTATQHFENIDEYIIEIIKNNINIKPFSCNKYRKIVFLGLPGAGKTTCMLKFCSAILNHKSNEVCISSTDSINIGEDDILQKYAEILNVEYVQINNLSNKLNDVILIDSHESDLRQSSTELGKFISNKNVTKVLVVSALSNSLCVENIINILENTDNLYVVLTMMDLNSSIGGILNVLIKKKTPIAFVIDSSDILDFPKDVSNTTTFEDMVKNHSFPNKHNDLNFKFSFMR